MALAAALRAKAESMQDHAASPLAIDERIKLQRRTAQLMAKPPDSPLGARLSRLRRAHAGEEEQEEATPAEHPAVSQVIVRRGSSVQGVTAAAAQSAAASPRMRAVSAPVPVNEAADRLLREAGGERSAPGQGSALLFMQNAGCDAVRVAPPGRMMLPAVIA